MINTANEVHVKRVVIINATMPQWGPIGYLRGKLFAEQSAKDFVGKLLEHNVFFRTDFRQENKQELLNIMYYRSQ